MEIGKRCIVFLQKKLVSLQKPFTLSSFRSAAIRRLAGFSIYFPDIFCMATIAMDGRKRKKQETLFFTGIPRHVHLEYFYHLVDMECF